MKANRKFTGLSVLASILIWLLPFFLFAETIVLRKGGTVTGKIITQSRKTVRISTSTGTRSIAKSDIKRIIYGPSKDELKKRKEAEARRKKAREERKKKLKELREKRKKEREELEKKKDDEKERKRLNELRRLQEEQLKKEKERKSLEPEEPSLAVAVGYSMLLPGAGQLYQGRGAAGGSYMGGFFTLALGAAAAIYDYRWSRTQYKKAAWTFFFFLLIRFAIKMTLPQELAEEN